MRSLFWVCAVLVVISGVVSAKLWRDLHAERLLATSLQEQLAEAAGTERAIVPPAPRTETGPAAPPAPAAAAAPAKKPTQATNSSEELRKILGQERELLNDPEYRKARLAQIRASIPRNYPGLAEELGLSEAEADKLFDLMADYQMSMSGDISLLVSDQNDPAANQERMRKQQELSRQREEGIAAQLGSARYAQYQQYQQNAPARSRVSSMNNMLAQSGQPLNAGQVKSLTAALITETQRQRQESMALNRNFNPQDPAARAQLEETSLRLQREFSQRVLAAAAPLLNAQQLATVRAQMEQQDALSQAFSRAAAAQARARAQAQTQAQQ